MISRKEIKVLDINSEYFGTPSKKLMENAGKGVADFITKQINAKNRKILFICGTGNNGGDGFVAARYLTKKFDITVFLTGQEKDIKTEIAEINFKKLNKKDLEIFDYGSINKLDKLISENYVIVDSMLGIGLSGNLREPYLTIVNKINTVKNKIIISVDIPTGFGTKTFIKPDYTVTFHDIKIEMKKENCGEISKIDIGIPKKAIQYIGPGELSIYYPRPKKESHKGENGRLLIVGGGPYIGAPALSGFAALRTGSDLVYITTPKRAGKAITSFSPLVIKPKRLAEDLGKISLNIIVKELNHNDILIQEDLDIIKKNLAKVDTVVIGPGLGSENATLKTIEILIKKCVNLKKSMVIDADAIQVIGKKPDIIKNSKTVITPHAGEFKELAGIKLSNNLNERKIHVEKWANKIGVTIFLKGQIDIISNGVVTKFNDIHNSAMTVGGTGDVLSGIIGSLLSKKVEPFDAARIGAFLNGAAGNNAFEKNSYGLIATDIIKEIPSILKKYL